ncbi:MAG: FAD:protein FMN transferase [Planctomycetota bacterium]
MLTAIFALVILQSPPPREPLVVTRGLMGTRFQVALVGDDDTALEKLAREALDEVERVERVLNNWLAASSIALLNADASAGWRDVDPILAEVVAISLDFHANSDGAFDITIAPLLDASGFYSGERRELSSTELAALHGRIGSQWLRVERDPPRIRREKPGMQLDVSGMSKGFAVDRAVAVLRARGVTNAFVAGGSSTVYALGRGVDGSGWPFFVGEGFAPEEWRLVDEAVGTSGRLAQSLTIDGATKSHIIDVSHGGPVERDVAMAVFRCPTGTEADLTDTALVAMGEARARTWFAKRAQSGAWHDGKMRAALLFLDAKAERVGERVVRLSSAAPSAASPDPK